MAKKKKDNYSEEQIKKMAQIILSLVNVYGPLLCDELVDKIEEYFPDEYKAMDEEYIFNMIFLMIDNEMFFMNEDEIVSIFMDKELEELYDIEEIRMVSDVLPDKVFEDKEELLKYADIFELDDPSLKRLKTYLDSLTFKEGEDKEAAFGDAVIVVMKMYDEEIYFTELQKHVKDKIDKDLLSGLMKDFGGRVPRGFLHGHSFAEAGEQFGRLELSDFFESDRLEVPTDYIKYPAYSYRECLVMANKLKDTNIFESFVSDNIIELLVNGKEIFVQLLGYYNGDRCVIIYGDEEDFKYNYHFYMSRPEDYPDLASRIQCCEVLMDDPGGFMTPEMEEALDRKKYAALPLIAQKDKIDPPCLPDQQHCSLIGAVLKQLLTIYDELDEDIGERCEEGNTFKVIQFYLHKEGFDIGEYVDLEIGDPYLPFEVEELKSHRIRAKQKVGLGIGTFIFGFTEAPEPYYLTLLYDHDNDLIISYDLCMESEMSDVKDRIVDKLEEADIRPSEITFNNDFCMEIFDELLDLYDIEEDFYIGDEAINDIYRDFTRRGGIEDPFEEIVIH